MEHKKGVTTSSTNFTKKNISELLNQHEINGKYRKMNESKTSNLPEVTNPKYFVLTIKLVYRIG